MKTPRVHRTCAARWHCGLLVMGLLTVLAVVAASTADPSGPPGKEAAHALRARPAGAAASEAGTLWADTADLLPSVAERSQRFLVGTRDPNRVTCVLPNAAHNVFALPDGGIGAHLANFMAGGGDQRPTVRAAYAWFQTTLKPHLVDLKAQNHEAYAKALRLARQADRLAERLAETHTWPADLKPAGPDLPSTCIGTIASRLDQAIAERDLAQARRWSSEFASATFSLADLHRWANYILRNQLVALDFQARCSELFKASEKTLANHRKVILEHGLDSFPAGQAMSCAVINALEVEHQAEWLFVRPPEAWSASSGPPAPAVPAAGWMPPNLRSAFMRLRGHLTPETRALLDEAAHTPYDRTYLANVLYRLQTVGRLDEAGTVLERFDRVQTDPTRDALLDVLFYHSGIGIDGRTWDDRFDPRLMEAAETLAGSPEQALLGAQHFTRAAFGAWSNFSSANDLREALDKGILDCITATDMIGCLYRNAGYTGFYNVRWCTDGTGHSVAGTLVRRGDQDALVLVDGLDRPQIRAERWPEAYAKGHPWPAGYTGKQPPIYAVEVYARGLDAYLWMQGYIVRGPHAGRLVRTTIPYLPPASRLAHTPRPQARHAGRSSPAPAGARHHRDAVSTLTESQPTRSRNTGSMH